MKDIFAIIKENGIEIPADKVAPITAAVRENYKTIAEFTKKADRITDLEKQNGELSEQVKSFSGSDEELKSLRQKVTDYETAETERKKSEEAAAKLNGLKTRFSGLKGEKEYLNEGTENWIFSEFQKALEDSANSGKSDADIYSAITENKNIYVNPQQKTVIPPARGSGSGSSDKEMMDQLYKDNPFYKQ